MNRNAIKASSCWNLNHTNYGAKITQTEAYTHPHTQHKIKPFFFYYFCFLDDGCSASGVGACAVQAFRVPTCHRPKVGSNRVKNTLTTARHHRSLCDVIRAGQVKPDPNCMVKLADSDRADSNVFGLIQLHSTTM